MRRTTFVFALGLSVAAACGACTGAARSNADDDERTIKALFERYSEDVKARNIDRIMALYASGDNALIAFDPFPPREYIGAAAYRKAYESFFAAYPGPIRSDISNVRITLDGNVAFVSSIYKWTATGSDGKDSTFVFRVTDGLQKIDGNWRIVHEHASVPVDPTNGQADFLSKPQGG